VERALVLLCHFSPFVFPVDGFEIAHLPKHDGPGNQFSSLPHVVPLHGTRGFQAPALPAYQVLCKLLAATLKLWNRGRLSADFSDPSIRGGVSPGPKAARYGMWSA